MELNMDKQDRFANRMEACLATKKRRIHKMRPFLFFLCALWVLCGFYPLLSVAWRSWREVIPDPLYRFGRFGQLQGGGIEGVYGVQSIAVGRCLQGLVHDKGIGEVGIGSSVSLQGAPDHCIVLKANVGFLQQFVHDGDKVGLGCAIPVSRQCPQGLRQYDVRNEDALRAFKNMTRPFGLVFVILQEIAQQNVGVDRDQGPCPRSRSIAS